MVDTKFLIVTTLCYVGILIVVLAVCCCAWARYMKNEGRMPPIRRTNKLSRGRQAAREAPQQCPRPPPPRQYRYIGDFTELNYPHQPTTYPHLQHNFRTHAGSMPRPVYPNVNHHYTLEGYPPPRNYYPASLATPSDTYDMELQMDVCSAAYGDTSQGGFSGEEFSDFESSRYDSGHDVSGVISGDGAVLSCSDVGNSLKIANNNSVDTNELTNEFRRSTDALKHVNIEVNYTREITVDVTDKLSIQSDICAVESLLVTSLTEECNGVTPSCSSAESLTEFNDQPEQIPLNSN